ncbi:MAG TPA: NAD(P)-binding domain-containing protein [Candidatus Dormibacteraeota bacterium]|nr:NAD(P)-binding domain-containing protein [Candidatus Dormibacteraeota bacterium]
MKVAVIGAGRIGGTIGGRWEKAGHQVVYGLRDPGKHKNAKPITDALRSADVVLLAIPGNAVVQFAREHARDLDGKTVIDATNNPGNPGGMHSWSELTKALPQAKLYRAFNGYGWEVFANPKLRGETPDLFYAGPGSEIDQLITDAGLNPVRVGGADAVDMVDGVLRLWFTLSQSRGRRIAFKLLAD